MLSCITDAVPDVSGGYFVAADPHALTLNRGDSVQLHGTPGISFAMVQHYRIIEDSSPRGPWRVVTVTYSYVYEDHAGHEILAFHWHPDQRSTITFPHLHLGYGAGQLRPELHRAHIPTGRVSLAHVIALGIRELGVEPLRSDWESVVAIVGEALNE
jgi:hypothetical protein